MEKSDDIHSIMNKKIDRGTKEFIILGQGAHHLFIQIFQLLP